MTTMLLLPHLLANADAARETLTGADLLIDSVRLAKETAAAWDKLWDSTLSATPNTLWAALCQLGLALAMVSILYVAFTEGKEIIEKQAWGNVASLFAWPLVIVFFLANNGSLLSSTVLMVRSVGHFRVQGVLSVQIAGTGQSIAAAVSQVTSDITIKQQIEGQFAQCQNEAEGEARIKCFETAQQNADQILNSAPPSVSDFARDWLPKIIGFFSKPAGAAASLVLNGPSIMMQVAKAILWGLQWAFVTLLEVSLLLTALFSPIAMGLSLLPMGARPIVAWLTGFISLFGLQLGYNIIIGLAAIVMTNVGTVQMSDLGFLLFISVFAPVLATVIAAGGGMAAYNAMNSGAKQVISFGADLVAAPVRLLAPR